MAHQAIQDEDEAVYLSCSQEDGKTLYDHLRYNIDHHIVKFPTFNAANIGPASMVITPIGGGTTQNYINILEIVYGDYSLGSNFKFVVVVNDGNQENYTNYILTKDGVFELESQHPSEEE